MNITITTNARNIHQVIIKNEIVDIPLVVKSVDNELFCTITDEYKAIEKTNAKWNINIENEYLILKKDDRIFTIHLIDLRDRCIHIFEQESIAKHAKRSHREETQVHSTPIWTNMDSNIDTEDLIDRLRQSMPNTYINNRTREYPELYSN